MKDNILTNSVRISSAYLLLTILFCSCFFSCKKNDKDLSNDINNYVSKNLSAYAEIPLNGIDEVIANLSIVEPSNTKAGFPALLVEPHNEDVEIIARINNDSLLVKAYNNLYSEKASIMPDGLLKVLEQGKIIIRAGETQSADSIKLEVDSTLLGQIQLPNGKYTYLVPITLESKSKNVKLKSELMFILYRVSASNINITASLKKKPFVTNLTNNTRNVSLYNSDINLSVPIVVSTNTNKIGKNIPISLENIGDKAFLDAYNVEHSTGFKPFPDGAVKLDPSTTNLPAFSYNATGDMMARLVDTSGLDPYIDYMMVVKMKNDIILLDENDKVIYIVRPKQKVDATNTIDRKDWEITYFDNVTNASTSPTSWLTDGIYSSKDTLVWSAPFGNSLPHTLTIDMGSIQSTKGFVMVSNNFGNIAEMEVFSSNNGNNGEQWEPICTWKGFPESRSKVGVDFKSAYFPNAVAARYFRLKITRLTETGSNYITTTMLKEIYALK